MLEAKPNRSLSDIHNIMIIKKSLKVIKWSGLWFDVGTYQRYKEALYFVLKNGDDFRFDIEICPRTEMIKATLFAEKLSNLLK